MWQALGDAIDALSADDGLRCVIVRGAGEKAFSPGNDIAEFATERANKAQAIDYGRVMHAHGATRSPSAATRWSRRSTASAWAAGSRSPRCATCASAANRAASARRSRTSGLVMAYPEMAPLVRLAGPDVALEILLEGRDLRRGRGEGEAPRHARRAGCRRRRRSAGDGAADRRRRAARRALAQEVRAPARRSAPITAAEHDECFDCFDTEDFRIGYAAFLAKQKPEFVGR